VTYLGRIIDGFLSILVVLDAQHRTKANQCWTLSRSRACRGRIRPVLWQTNLTICGPQMDVTQSHNAAIAGGSDQWPQMKKRTPFSSQIPSDARSVSVEWRKLRAASAPESDDSYLRPLSPSLRLSVRQILEHAAGDWSGDGACRGPFLTTRSTTWDCTFAFHVSADDRSG
jgi:hypothetical protein